MATVPNKINNVEVEFESDVDNFITDNMLDGLKFAVKSDIAAAHTLEKVFVSSIQRSTSWPSRHATGNAIDFSRINGQKMSAKYPGTASVKAIVDALQNKFEEFDRKRENFGPLFNKKEGNNFPNAGDHTHHIHWSVDGPHTQP